ncbi:TonB-dependent receptor plug domain-containing protein [bacterium]|nr:TonB-dependent receptor plug domain-containing protein [bacterium]
MTTRCLFAGKGRIAAGLRKGLSTLRVVLTVVGLLLLVQATAVAYGLSGRILDGESGDPIADANVWVEGQKVGTSTTAEGIWTLTGLKEGTYTIHAGHVAYYPEALQMQVPPIVDEELVIRLQPRVHPTEGVVLRMDRLEESTATTPYTNIDRAELQQRYYGQDLPVALEGVPSLTTYTDAGNALGYSYLTMRGVDFKRIGVYLNGVMLNDPEDFYVYWVDLADFGANVEDVQVQRGVAAVPYGLPSVGGTINVQTQSFSEEPEVTAEYGIGSYNTRRWSAHLASGPVENKYYFDARFSRITSDGYRDKAWADYFSYYLSGVRRGERTTTRIVLFGGPISNHMAYAGATREQLAQNRTYNPLAYYGEFNDETDNYYQPHYQLHHTWRINDSTTLKNTLYHIRGEGHFNVYYPSWWGYTWDFWDLPQLTTDDADLYPSAWYRYDSDGNLVTNEEGEYFVDFTDAVAKQAVHNHQYGWQPRISVALGRHNLTVGGQVMWHRSQRFGDMIWAEALPAGTSPNHRWYDYQGRKLNVNLFARDIWQATDRLSFTGAVQLASIRYEVLKDRRFGAEFDQTYLFATPHTGFSYQLSDPIRLWGGYSYVQREPRLKDHYWAETGYPRIGFEDPVNFEAPLIQPETLHDFEIGTDWRSEMHFLRVNGYWMEMTDEIVDIGEYDVTGQPVIENAERTRRYGVEFGGRYLLPSDFYLEGNINLASNRFVDYTSTTSVVDEATGWGVPVTVDNADNPIIKAPERLANLAAGWNTERAAVRLSMHHVGEQYLDNTYNFDGLQANIESSTLAQDRRIDAYTRFDLALHLDLVGETKATAWIASPGLPEMKLSLFVRNLLDEEYFINGLADAWGVYVIPAAKRHYMAQLHVTL